MIKKLRELLFVGYINLLLRTNADVAIHSSYILIRLDKEDADVQLADIGIRSGKPANVCCGNVSWTWHHCSSSPPPKKKKKVDVAYKKQLS